jgi:putative serine protease PepD
VSLPPLDDGGAGDEDPDPTPSGAPPHPMDRIWRHPSELPVLADPPARGPGPSLRRSIVLCLGAGAVGALLAVGVLAAAGVFEQSNSGSPARTSAPRAAADEIAALTARVAPAIVTVRVTTKDGSRTGSGVCIRHGGQVLTSARLLAGARSVVVVTAQGSAEAAKVLGVDPSSDLSLLAINGELDAADLSPGALRIGDPVYAVGTDAAGSPWVSTGIVSSLDGRVAGDGTTMSGLIEIDSIAESFASGGALLDSGGRVAGILMTPVTGHPTAVAVPIGFASKVADGLRADGHVDHGWLGLAGRVNDGHLVITTLARGGPSQRAGIKVGDVIVAVDSEPIADMEDLMAAARGHWPGQHIDVVVARDRGDLSLSVKLSSMPTTTTTSTPTVTVTTVVP